MRIASFAAALWLGLMPNAAFAHLASTRFGEFYSGLLHPYSTLTHLLPWLALGLLGGLQSPATVRWVLLAFPLAVAVGATLGSWLPPWPPVDTLNLLSFIVLGLGAALALRLGRPAFLGVAALFGISHGYANGIAELSGSERLLYIGGVACAAYVLIALVTAAAQTLAQQRQWGSIAVRAAGSWVVAVGLIFGGFTLLALGA